MKSLYFLTLILLCISANATTIYVSTTGNDATGNGTSGNPYATLHKASTVAVNGDVIHINAGRYTENNQCTIATGVSIEGADSSTTFITTNYVGGNDNSAFLMLGSSNPGTNGNQHIWNISFDGNNLTGDRCLYIGYRSNVSIYGCSFKHFIAYAISFKGTTSAYSYNDQLYNSTIYDCAGTHGTYGGAILMTATDSLQIHDCMLVDTSRSQGNNGNIIGGVSGYNRGLKYYNNVSWKPLNDKGNNYNCTLEFWFSEGVEIYGNTFNGGGYTIDDGGTGFFLTGKYPYKFYIHDNVFQQFQQVPNSTGYFAVALNNESGQGRDWFIKNKVINYPTGVNIIIGYANNVKSDSNEISKNLFVNCGYSDGTNNYQGIIELQIYQNSYRAHGDTISNTLIYNNTFYTVPGAGKAKSALVIECDSTVNLVRNTKFLNNIIDGAVGSYGYITFWEYQSHTSFGLIDNTTSTNNVVYGNANSNNILYRTGRNSSNVTNVVESSILKSDPKLNLDYSLQLGSPAINAAINIGYGSDIGAIPYGSTTILPIANAGVDQIITFPADSVKLTGSGINTSALQKGIYFLKLVQNSKAVYSLKLEK